MEKKKLQLEVERAAHTVGVLRGAKLGGRRLELLEKSRKWSFFGQKEPNFSTNHTVYQLVNELGSFLVFPLFESIFLIKNA